jgi:DnaK suppressor protein
MSSKEVKINPEILAEIKKELQAQKEKIERELNKVANNSSDHAAKFPEFGEKPDENAQEIEGYTTNLATKEMLEANLRDINSSLKRIDDGSYGVCKYCGNEIGEKRLLARPVASTCIDCKTKLQNS